MNPKEVLLSLAGDRYVSYAIPYLMADETFAGIEFGDLTTTGTVSSDYIVVDSTFISTFIIDSQGPITLTFNPSAINLQRKINRIIYNFDDGSAPVINNFYYAPTSFDTFSYPFSSEPGDPRNFKVTKTFSTSQYFQKTFKVIVQIYQFGIQDPTTILYIINVNAPEMDGLNSGFFEEIHLVSTRMFGVNDDILYTFETKNPNYLIPFLLNWKQQARNPVLTTNIIPQEQRSFKLLQPYELDSINKNPNILNIPLVNSTNKSTDHGTQT